MCSAAERTEALRYDALILATGATDRLLPVPADPAGRLQPGRSQIALKAQACAIGARPVFMGTGPLLYLVAYQYAKAGVRPRRARHRGVPSPGRSPAVPGGAAKHAGQGRVLQRALAAQRITMMTASCDRDRGEERVTSVLFLDARGGRSASNATRSGSASACARDAVADLAHCDFAFMRWRGSGCRRSTRMGGPRRKASTSPATARACSAPTRRTGGAAGRLRRAGRPGAVGAGRRDAALAPRLRPMARFRKGLEHAFAFPRASPPPCRTMRWSAAARRSAPASCAAPRPSSARPRSTAPRPSAGRHGPLPGPLLRSRRGRGLAATLDVPVEQVGACAARRRSSRCDRDGERPVSAP